MATLHLLGTGAALSDSRRTTTMLAFSSDSSVVVVDCGGDVVQRLLAHDLDLDAVAALILTHEHPDHVSGFPLFMEKIWLAGRRRPMPVFGPAAAVDQARRTFETFDTSGWTGLPDIEWNEVEPIENARVLDDESWSITASPGEHSVPVIALRVRAAGSGVTTYSADTEPAVEIARLARDADILVHEASGDFAGHSSIVEAAKVAAEARAKRLVLVHLPPEASDSELEEARQVFPAADFGVDGARLEF